MEVTRRQFLKSSGIAIAGMATGPAFVLRAAARRDQPVIIAIFQRGAADGVSMVIPIGDSAYAPARPQIAIQDAVDLDGFFGLHPSLDGLKPIFDQRHLAIIHAVGSPNGTRSHFDAQDYMESGTPGMKSTSDGWLNRYMKAASEKDGTPFRAVAISPTLPRSMMGSQPALAMQRIDDFGIRAGRATPEVEDLFAGLYKDTFDAVKLLRNSNPQRYSPVAGVDYPRTPYGQALLQVAQLIKSEIGLEIAFVDIGGWDTHANQGSSRGQLANQLKNFGDGIAALYHDLGDRMRDIVIVTMTEFGRAIRQNGSAGTDHGHGSCSFVLGGPVKGGAVYGRWPGLAPEQLFEGRDLAVTTDFRDVFSEILTKHMRLQRPQNVFPGFSPDKPLGIFPAA